MQYSTLFVAFLASMVAAQTASKTDVKSCKEMTKLNALVNLAANETKLDAVTKNNATKIQDIKDKAAKAQTTLTTLMNNATLMSTCEVVDAQIMQNSTCTQEFLLGKFVAFAANDTLVTATVQGDATKAADIQLKASMAADKLQQLQTNTTLNAACPAVFAADECKMVKQLNKFAQLATNQTKLDKIAKGNTTKSDAIKNEAMMAGQQAMMMEANATLMASCKTLGISTDATVNGKATTSAGVINEMSVTVLFLSALAVGMTLL